MFFICFIFHPFSMVRPNIALNSLMLYVIFMAAFIFIILIYYKTIITLIVLIVLYSGCI